MSFEQEGHGYSEGTPRCFIPEYRNMLLDVDRFAAIIFGDTTVARQTHLPHNLPHWMPHSMLVEIQKKPFFLAGESMGGGATTTKLGSPALSAVPTARQDSP